MVTVGSRAGVGLALWSGSGVRPREREMTQKRFVDLKLGLCDRLGCCWEDMGYLPPTTRGLRHVPKKSSHKEEKGCLP